MLAYYWLPAGDFEGDTGHDFPLSAGQEISKVTVPEQ
jgi:hypothetical protein